MQQPEFISLHNSIESAMYYNNSPMTEVFYIGGVQLLPSSPYAYVQRTYAAGGMNLEVNDAVMLDMCGNELTAIPPECLEIIQVLNDPNTGLPQVEWSFLPTGLDFGLQPVYIHFRQSEGSVFSSPFYCTDEMSDFTSRWDYRNKDSQTMLSTQLMLWYRQPKSEMTIENYRQVSTGREVTIASQNVKFERWQTSVIESYIFERFKDIFRNRFVYCNLQRAYLKEAIETPDTQDQENFIEQEFELFRNGSELYDPNFVPVVPPAPPVPTRMLNLTSVVPSGINNALYYWEAVNYTPEVLTYQFSLDQINWSNNTQAATSPREIRVNGAADRGYFYRVLDPINNIVSNIVTISVPQIQITNITTQQSVFYPSRNRIYYNVFYTFSLVATQDNDIECVGQISVDGVTWVQGSTFGLRSANGMTLMITPVSATQYTYFRIIAPSRGITSNVFRFTLPEAD